MTKEELELKKLQIEVKEMETHWLKKPKYLSIMIPAVLTISVLMFGMVTEYIDFEGKKLGFEQKTKKLELEQNALKDSLKTIKIQIDKDIKFNEKLKVIRYLETITINAYYQLRSSDELTKKLDYLSSKFDELGPKIFGEHTFIEQNETWLKVKAIVEGWSIDESPNVSLINRNKLANIFLKLRNDVIKNSKT